MKKRFILGILFLTITFASYGQDCFVSKSFEKSFIVFKKLNPQVKKIYFENQILDKWKGYKLGKLIELVNNHKLNFNNLYFTSSTYLDFEAKLLFCYGVKQRLKKMDVEIYDDLDPQINSIYCCFDLTDFPQYQAATILPYFPEFITDNKILIIFSVYFTPALKDTEGNIFYMPIKQSTDLEHPEPDIFVFVFKKKDKDNNGCKSDNFILEKLQIIYGKGEGKKNIFCDTPEEVNALLEKNSKR